jgi:hypothetical protein
MFDPTMRQVDEAAQWGPLNVSEMIGVMATPVADVDPVQMIRFLMTINHTETYVRDIAMNKHRDLAWWASLTREVDGLSIFFNAPACITAWLLLKAGNKQAGRDLIYLVLAKDNAYALAVLLMRIVETDFDSFANIDNDLAAAIDKQIPEWDKIIADYRADSDKWKAA